MVRVEGNVPSKKNSKSAFYNKYLGRSIIVSSKKFHEWHKTALNCLLSDRTTPITLSSTQLIILHISAPTRRKYDLTNKAESVMDLLVDYGLLEDDNSDIVPLLLLVKHPVSENGYFEAMIYTQV